MTRYFEDMSQITLDACDPEMVFRAGLVAKVDRNGLRDVANFV